MSASTRKKIALARKRAWAKVKAKKAKSQKKKEPPISSMPET